MSRFVRIPIIPKGGQPVPTVTPTGGTNPIVGPIPSRLSPRGGIPPKAGGNLLGKGMQVLGKGMQGLAFLGAANELRKGNVGGAVAQGSLMAPFPYMAGAAGLFAVGDGLMTPGAGDGTLDSISENLSPEQQALRDKLLKERIAAGSQKATVGNSGLMNMPPSVNTNLAAYAEGVTLPAVGSAGNAGGYNPGTSQEATAPISQLLPQDRAYAKERARVEAMVKSNPDMQKQDIAAARAKVRDQGLAEWAKANPELAKNVRPGQVGYEIARDVAYPMPTSPADSSTPQLYNPQLQYDPGFGRTISNTDVKPSVVDTSTQLPPSAEQTYMNPDFYQLQGYQQGQGAAASQTEGPKVAKLGSAIRRELYPQFDGTTSFSPQMRETFPDRSTQSLENVVQEKGVQLPDSMITADGQTQLLFGLTDNRMYQYNQQVAEVDKLLKLIADRQLLK